MAEKHIYVFGDIGWEVRLADIAKQTEGAVKGEDSFIVHIHSPGGDVNEGFAIHDHLRAFGIPIETRIEGLCASIATVIALAGEKRTMTENSTFFVHNPWMFAGGDADELQRMTDELRAVEDRLAAFYSKVTGQEKTVMLDLMKAETSMTAEEAKSYGFVTEVVLGVKAAARINSNQPNQNKPDSFMNKLKETIDATINAAMAKFGIKAQAEPVKASIETTLEDGTAVKIESESEVPTVGDMVTLADGSPAPDGEHTLADGTMITTEAGSITAVTPPAAASAEEQIAALQASIAEKDATIAALQTENAEFQNSIKNAQHVITEMQAKLESKVVLPTRTQNFNHRKQEPAPKSFTTAAILENVKKASAKK